MADLTVKDLVLLRRSILRLLYIPTAANKALARPLLHRLLRGTAQLEESGNEDGTGVDVDELCLYWCEAYAQHEFCALGPSAPGKKSSGDMGTAMWRDAHDDDSVPGAYVLIPLACDWARAGILRSQLSLKAGDVSGATGGFGGIEAAMQKALWGFDQHLTWRGDCGHPEVGESDLADLEMEYGNYWDAF